MKILRLLASRSILSFICLAFCLAVFCARAQAAAPFSPVTYQDVDSLYRTIYTDESPGKGMGWKPYKRFNWFWGQRAYPTGEIPAGLRWQEFQAKIQSEKNRNTLDDPTWQEIGPLNMAGRLLDVAIVSSSPNTIYVGSASGGIWKTTNGGANWIALDDNLPTLAVGAVAIDPTNSNIVYIGTGEGSFNWDAVYGAGVLKSTDAGATWNTTGLSWSQSQYRAVNTLVIDPTNPNIIYAAMNRYGSYGGIYKSTNGGTTWGNYLTGYDIKDLVMHPDSSQVLYCVAGYPWGSSSNGVYKSTNGGTSWTKLSNGLPSSSTQGRQALAISPSSPTTVYVGISKTLSGGAGLLGVYRTTDAGASWSLRASTPNFYGGQGWYNNVLAVHPTDPNTIYASGIDLYKSSNGGSSWTQLTYWYYSPGHSQYAHADHHALAFHPSNPNTVYAGTDGGLFRSTNGGTSWTGLNNGLATFQFYAMGNSLLAPSECFGGTQDNGTNKYTGSTSWSEVYGGDGGYCVVDYTNPNIVYAETQMGSHVKSTNGGVSWYSIQTGISGYGAWVTPVVMEPTNPQVLYTATRKVYKTTNGGSNWSAISSDLTSYYISTLAVAPSATNTIYAGCEGGGRVYKTTNGGMNWSSAYSGLPSRYVTRVAVHPSDANTVYATVSGYGSGHVYKSTNGGSSWSNLSTGLPDQPVNDIVIDGADPSMLYAGTDLGVYRSTNGGSSWASFSTGLPNVVVDDLALHPTAGTLRAATHGRGMWEVSIGTPSLTVTSPNGGEEWGEGGTSEITWSTGGLSGNVSIEVNRNYPSGGWETLFSSTSNDGSANWVVTGPTTSSARIRITSLSNPSIDDESNANFSIVEQHIEILSPNGGEDWVYSTTKTISWSRVGTSPYVAIEINRNYPTGDWEWITATTSLSYDWDVTSPATSNARVRAKFSIYPNIGDTSDASFTISAPGVTITSPNGGDVWMPGEMRTIRWTRQNLTTPVKVELNRNYPSGSWEELGSSVSADSLVRTVNGPGSSHARVRVTSTTYPEVSDISNSDFTVLSPSLTLLTPNGGELWPPGTAQTIQWQYANIFGGFNLYVNRSYPMGDWELICVGNTSQTFEWTVSGPVTSTARIKVVSAAQGALEDISNANFSINEITHSLDLTSPNGGEVWVEGDVEVITWTRDNAPGYVTVALNRDYPSGAWETLTTTVGGNSFSYTVAGAATNLARIKIYLTASPTVSDVSASNFTMMIPSITVTNPCAGDTLAVGSSMTVQWTRSYATGNATVQLNRSFPSGGWETLTTTASGNSFDWMVATPETEQARMRVFLTSDPSIGDTCDGEISIVIPTLSLISPGGGEVWLTGANESITWSRRAAAGNVMVQLCRDFPGGAWETLSSGEADNMMTYTVTGPTGSDNRVRIILNSNPSVGDTSDSNFIIATPTLTISSPLESEFWVVDSTHTVRWIRTYADGAVTVELDRNYPSGLWESLTTTATGDSFSIVVTEPRTEQARVRAFLSADETVADTSDGNFSIINPGVILHYPIGGEILAIHDTVVIRWQRREIDSVNVLIDRAGPAPDWETIASNLKVDSLVWIVPGPESVNCRIKVESSANPDVFDVSAAPFSMLDAELELTTPPSGDTLGIGNECLLAWGRTDAVPGSVRVEICRDYPSENWSTLVVTEAESLVWSISEPATDNARFRVISEALPWVGDTSDANHAIVYPELELLSPSGTTVWEVGRETTIRWRRAHLAPGVTVELNREWPSGDWEILATAVNIDSFHWAITAPVAQEARLHLRSDVNSFGEALSDSLRIIWPNLTLTSPIGGEIFGLGYSYETHWERTDYNGPVAVYLERISGGGEWELLADNIFGENFNWLLEGNTSQAARVKIVSEDGFLADTSGDFAIVYPEINIIQPNGGNILSIDYPYQIQWNRLAALGQVVVEVNRDYPGGAWETLTDTVETNAFSWIVPEPENTTNRIRIYLVNRPEIGDTSQGNFSISIAGLWVIAPNGGDTLITDQETVLRWQRVNTPGPISVELNRDYPDGDWELIAGSISDDSLVWTVDEPPTLNARLRVKLLSDTLFKDVSDNDFSIYRPTLILHEPSAGDTLPIGAQLELSWERIGVPGKVHLYLKRVWPSGGWEPVAFNQYGNSFTWNITGPEASAARFRVLSGVNTSWGDTTDGGVRIAVPSLWLDAPVGGEEWPLGGETVIRWTRENAPGEVSVLLSRNGASDPWENIGSSFSDSLLWEVTGDTTRNARVKLSHNEVPLEVISDANHAILEPRLTLLSPQGEEIYGIGHEMIIRWAKQAVAGPVEVSLERTGLRGEIEILADEVWADSLLWIVTGPETEGVVFSVRSLSGPETQVSSPATIRLAEPALSLISPVEGSALIVGEICTLKWERTVALGTVRVEINRNHPVGTWELIAESEADSVLWEIDEPTSAGVAFRIQSILNPEIEDQVHSLQIISPNLTLTSPVGGEIWGIGNQESISWERRDYGGAVDIFLKTFFPSGEWELLVASVSGDSYLWTVTSDTSFHARIKISATEWLMSDSSQSDFSIVYPQVLLISPEPGDTLVIGKECTVRWNRFEASGLVRVEINRDFPSGAWESLASGILADSLLWAVSGSDGVHNRLRIFLEERTEIGDTTQGDITIGQPELVVTSPLNGDTCFTNAIHTISWTRHFASGAVTIDVSHGEDIWEEIATGITQNSYAWLVQGNATNEARVRVKLESDTTVSGTSDEFHILNPALFLTAPQSGDTFVVGESRMIRWSRLGYAGSVDVELMRQWPGGIWELISGNVSGDSVAWNVVEPGVSSARMRITAVSNPTLKDTSGSICILNPTLSLVYPLGDEIWPLGEEKVIRWARNDVSGDVDVFLGRDGASGAWETLGSTHADSFVWQTAGDTTRHARVKITSVNYPGVEAISPSDFTITEGALMILAPEPNTLCYDGDEIWVRWQRFAADGPVSVTLVRDGLPEEVLGEGILADSLLWHVAPLESETSVIRIEHESSFIEPCSVQVIGPILPTITFEPLPNDTVWNVGENHTLHWTRHYADGAARVEMMLGFPGGNWEVVESDAMNDSIEIAIELPEDDHVRFRLWLVSKSELGDTTNRDVRIVQPRISLVEPEPGTRAEIGELLTVRWTRHELGGAVEVFLNRFYPEGAWQSIGVSSNDSLEWIVEGETTTRARLRVLSLDYPSAGDTLSGDIEFYRAGLEIQLSPPMDTIYITQNLHFEISRSDFNDPVNIELKRTLESVWESIATEITENQFDWTVTSPEAAGALVRVKASGTPEPCDTLNNTLTILAPSLVLTNPAPDETLTVGDMHTISWERGGVSGGVKVELVRGEESRETLAESVLEDSILWQVTAPRTSDARLFVQSVANPGIDDSSTVSFVILEPVLEITEPVGEGVDTVGISRRIAWRWTDGEGVVRVEMDRHFPLGPWEFLGAVEDTSFEFIPVGPESDSVRYRITAEENPALGDTSDERTLIEPAVTMTTPGGETWYIGETHMILWTRHHLETGVNLEVARDDRAEEWEALMTVEEDSFEWVVTGPATEFGRLRVTSSSDPRYTDTTDALINIIAPEIAITEPNGGEELTLGDHIRLRWTGVGFEGDVGVCLWRGSPVYRLDTLFAATPNDSLEQWTVEGEESDSCLLMIISEANPSIGDTSDDVFSIRGLLAEEKALPYKFELESNWPNPFNSMTNIRYSIARRTRVQLRIYNVLGQEVAVLEDRLREPGIYTLHWQPENIASGLYIVSMKADAFVRNRRMLLIK